MTAINLAGINRTALGSKVLATITISFLLLLFVASIALPNQPQVTATGDPVGIFSAAALFFFAFAGYARVATLGGEVKNSVQTAPRAIWISLAAVFGIYLVYALLLSNKLGVQLMLTVTPLADLAAKTWIGGEVVWLFTAVAGLGSLLALLAGMSRTAAEMSVDKELPKIFSRRLSNQAPVVAEITIAILVIVLITRESILLTLGLSSFAVLLYYAIVNFAAFRQPLSETNRPKFLNLGGLALCFLLALSVPIEGLVLGIAVLSAAMLIRWGLRAAR
jgi:APA family basic amino acid/polyamine antiporter